ncbi:SGNH/GDSL hydrolase family protein [Pseudomonas sp. N040]|uniref:SGNH/GDSL hydrolase family protein n=1 Tax=Pseudomonas sp. N040 TaxID=2785325 RepID=UPI0018A2C22C|nr:SGNH/GDSL hydrolase family protein [Pseudomonas sp. N040]MBF7731197.1 SGNH/GDSL hydrolase family protein [Pseudomonas sp. N040]MBW7014840.1 SGNH/GDSL hydrolase family protein [Pseudomonas sp. N040]
MIRLATLGWWLLLLILLPVLLVQAVCARRRAIRLEPAAGAQAGMAGQGCGEPLRVLLLGESTVAGVGVTSQQEALAGQFAAQLARRIRRPVAWQALGENGIAATQACERLLPQVADRQFDLVLLVFGVNDTTHFTSRRRWQTALATLAQPFSGPECMVAFTAVPPIQHFSALPWLLRRLLGWRAALLDRHMAEVAAQLGAEHCRVALEFTPGYLAVDGYHPSVRGYQVWAEGLCELLGGRFCD